jgi:hypothetical protein
MMAIGAAGPAIPFTGGGIWNPPRPPGGAPAGWATAACNMKMPKKAAGMTTRLMKSPNGKKARRLRRAL